MLRREAKVSGKLAALQTQAMQTKPMKLPLLQGLTHLLWVAGYRYIPGSKAILIKVIMEITLNSGAV